ARRRYLGDALGGERLETQDAHEARRYLRLRRHRRQAEVLGEGGDDAGEPRVVRHVGRERLARDGLALGRRLELGGRRSQRRGIGGGLDLVARAHGPAVVDGKAGDAEDRDRGQGEDDGDVAALVG